MTTKEELKKFLQERIQKFKEENAYKEAEDHIQYQYTAKLFDKLGWQDGKNAKFKKGQDTAKQSYPDITLKNNDRVLLIIESKDAKKWNKLDDAYDDLKFTSQLRNYIKKAGIDWGVLTNFVEWRIYNKRQKDLYKEEKYAFYDLLWEGANKDNYIDLLSDKGLEWLLQFTFENIVKIQGRIDDDPIYYENQQNIEEEIIKKDFFIKIRNWRSSLVKYIKHNYSNYENYDVLAQKIIDRLIFIEICHDKDIIGDNILSAILQAKDKKYELLKNEFRQKDEQFNSELFELSDVDNFKISDEILIPILEEIIHIDFSKLSVHIIGEVYENFLGELQRASTVEKEKIQRKTHGIYYTKQYIVKYIVRNTLGKVLDNIKNTNDLIKIKVLDTACGSGSFLICVFDEMLDAYRRINGTKEKGGNFFEFEDKKKILQYNIYGIDLDPKAVEITKLNLMIKALEGIKPDDLKGKHLLPNLRLNIRNNNSIINMDSGNLNFSADKIKELIELKNKFYISDDYEKNKILLFEILKLEKFLDDEKNKIANIENLERIKPINFDIAFCEVIKNGGFDVVVGNPPYLREKGNKKVFELINCGEYKKYHQGKMDYWYFFLHRAIDVVKQGGKIGFITNSYFLKGAGASKLIDRIKANTIMEYVVDFNDYKVFGDVSGKHIIHTYIKEKTNKTNKVNFIKINENDFDEIIDNSKGIKIPYLKIFDGSKISFDIDIVDYVKCKDLDSYYEVSQGVVEAVDKISNKALKKIKDDKFKAGEGVFVLNKKEKNELSLKDDEKNVIKKYLNPNNVEKYKINFRDEFLIYADKQNKELIKNNKFSNLKKHLDRMKKFITSSNKPYGLHRSREDHDTNEAKFFDNPKLICMCMFDKPSFAYDEDKYYVGMSFSVIIQKDLNYSLKYLLGLLNSKFGEYWFNKHGKRRGIGVDIGVQVFRLFPVYPATSEQQKEIEKIVNELTDIKSKINDNTKVEQKSKLELDFASKEIKLNDYIYKIYGFIPEEIEIIKETTK